MYSLILYADSIARFSIQRLTDERNTTMANIKSAKKRILVAQRNYERNVAFKSSIKTAVKKALVLAQAKEKDTDSRCLNPFIISIPS